MLRVSVFVRCGGTLKQSPALFSTTYSRLTITFPGNEQVVRNSINNLLDVNIIEKQYLAPHVKEKTSSDKLVLQFGYPSVFSALSTLTNNFSNRISEIYLLGGNVIEIHFSAELNQKEIFELLNNAGLQKNEFTGFDNSYNFKSAILKVPIGQENEWSSRLSRETNFVESAQQHEICAPIIDAPI